MANRIQRTSAIVSLLFTLALPDGASAATNSNCPVTLPSDQLVHSEDFKLLESGSHTWYGSSDLAALIPSDGVWRGFGKFWWWRKGFDARGESTPDLIVTAARLDGPASPVQSSRATSGFGAEWHAMLVGISFPSDGCWEVRGLYNGTQDLRMVFKVINPAKKEVADDA